MSRGTENKRGKKIKKNSKNLLTKETSYATIKM